MEMTRRSVFAEFSFKQQWGIQTEMSEKESRMQACEFWNAEVVVCHWHKDDIEDHGME